MTVTTVLRAMIGQRRGATTSLGVGWWWRQSWQREVLSQEWQYVVRGEAHVKEDGHRVHPKENLQGMYSQW